jgi:hypothetical protein
MEDSRMTDTIQTPAANATDEAAEAADDAVCRRPRETARRRPRSCPLADMKPAH